MRTKLTVHVIRHVALCFILARLTHALFWSVLIRPGPLEHPVLNSSLVSESQNDFVKSTATEDKELPSSDEDQESPKSAMASRWDNPGEKNLLSWVISLARHRKGSSTDQPRKRSYKMTGSTGNGMNPLLPHRPLNQAPLSEKRHSIIVHRTPNLPEILQPKKQNYEPLSSSHFGQHPCQSDYNGQHPYRTGQPGHHSYHPGQLGRHPYHADQQGQHPFHDGQLGQHSYQNDQTTGQHPYRAEQQRQHLYDAGRPGPYRYPTDQLGQHYLVDQLGQFTYNSGQLEQHPYYAGPKPLYAAHLLQQQYHADIQPYKAGQFKEHLLHAGHFRQRPYHDYGHPAPRPFYTGQLELHYQADQRAQQLHHASQKEGDAYKDDYNERHLYHTDQVGQYPHNPGQLRYHPYQPSQLGPHPYNVGHLGQHRYRDDQTEQHPYHAGQPGQYPYQAVNIRQHFTSSGPPQQHPYNTDQLRQYPHNAGQLGGHPYHTGQLGQLPYHTGQLGKLSYHVDQLGHLSYQGDNIRPHFFNSDPRGHHSHNTDQPGQYTYNAAQRRQHPFHDGQLIGLPYQADNIRNHPSNAGLPGKHVYHTSQPGQHSYNAGLTEEHYRTDRMGQYPYHAGPSVHLYHAGPLGQHLYHAGQDRNPYHAGYEKKYFFHGVYNEKRHQKNNIESHQELSRPRQRLHTESEKPVIILSTSFKTQSSSILHESDSTNDNQSWKKKPSTLHDENRIQTASTGNSGPSSSQHPPDFPSTNSPVSVGFNVHSSIPAFTQDSPDPSDETPPSSMERFGPQISSPGRSMVASTQEPQDIPSITSALSSDPNLHSSHPVLTQELTYNIPDGKPSLSLQRLGPQSDKPMPIYPSDISTGLKTQSSVNRFKSKSTDDVQSSEKTSSSLDDENRIHSFHHNPSTHHPAPSSSQQPTDFPAVNTPVSFGLKFHPSIPVLTQESAHISAGVTYPSYEERVVPKTSPSGRTIRATSQQPTLVPSSTSGLNFYPSIPVLTQESAHISAGVTYPSSEERVVPKTSPSGRTIRATSQQPTFVPSSTSGLNFYPSIPVLTQESAHISARVTHPSSDEHVVPQISPSGRTVRTGNQQPTTVPSNTPPGPSATNIDTSDPVLFQESVGSTTGVTPPPSLNNLEPQGPSSSRPTPASSQQPSGMPSTTSPISPKTNPNSSHPVFIQESATTTSDVMPPASLDRFTTHRPFSDSMISSTQSSPHVPSTISIVSTSPTIHSSKPMPIEESADITPRTTPSPVKDRPGTQRSSSRPTSATSQHPPQVPSTTSRVSSSTNIHSSSPITNQESTDIAASVTPSPSLGRLGKQTQSSHSPIFVSSQQLPYVSSTTSPFSSNPSVDSSRPESIDNTPGVTYSPSLNRFGKEKSSSHRPVFLSSQQPPHVLSTTPPVWLQSSLHSPHLHSPHPVLIQESVDNTAELTSPPSLSHLRLQKPSSRLPVPASSQQPPDGFPSTPLVYLGSNVHSPPPVFVDKIADNIDGVILDSSLDNLEPQRPFPDGRIPSSNRAAANVPSTPSPGSSYPNFQTPHPVFTQELGENTEDAILSNDLGLDFKKSHETRDFLKRSSFPKRKRKTASVQSSKPFKNRLRSLSHQPGKQPSTYAHPGHGIYPGHPFHAGYPAHFIHDSQNYLTPPFLVTDEKCDWKMIFKAVKGNGRSVYDDFVNPGGINTNEAEAREIPSNLPYRDDSVLDHWNSVYIKRVKLEIFNNGRRGTYLYFDGTASTLESWFSRERLIHSPYTDLRSKSPEIFSLQGDVAAGRRFYINQSEASCLDACGYLLVVDPSAAKECGHEMVEDPPYFLYSGGSSCGLWDADCFSHIGDRLVISVRVCQFNVRT